MNILSKKSFFTVFLLLFLSVPNFYSQNENTKISALLVQKKDFNKKHKNSIIYKIQLYNGDENEAFKVKRIFETTFPEYSIKIIYKAPEWKTQVGVFKTRLEADKVLNVIRQKFTGAIVLEDKI